MPGLLGSRSHFKKQFSDPVEHGQRHTATKRELATGRKAMHRLAKKMSGCFLRRTKTLIKGQLPKKEDRVRTVFVCIINYSSQFFFPEKHFFLGFLLLHVGFQKTSTELSFISFLVLLTCLPLGLQLVRVLVSFLLP